MKFQPKKFTMKKKLKKSVPKMEKKNKVQKSKVVLSKSKSVTFDVTKNKHVIFVKNSLPLSKAVPSANVTKSILKKPKKTEEEEEEEEDDEEEKEEEMMEEEEIEEGFEDEDSQEQEQAKENKPITKKGKKRPLEEETSEEVDKKPKVKKQELKKLRKEKKEGQDMFALKGRVKKLWEELRNSKCEGPRKEEVLKLLMQLVKDKLRQLIFQHDTSRVIECIVTKGANQHRTELFEELKENLVELSRSSYSKFFVLKLYKYGTKEQKEQILQSLMGKIPKLMAHKQASGVIETIYNEFANARQRAIIMQEFYGPQYLKKKDEEVKSLKDALEKEPTKKETILGFMKVALLNMINKEVTSPSLLHALLREFLVQAAPEHRAEVLGALCTNQLAILPLVHTRDGARVAMMAAWHSPARTRKILVKSLRKHVAKVAVEEHGHMFLLALLDCIDDTALLNKVLLPELMTEAKLLSENPQGRRVLVYLVAPRNPRYFHPDLVRMLAEGDGNEHTKKDIDTRRKELSAAASPLLAQFLSANLTTLRAENATSLLLSTILTHMTGDLEEIYRPLAKQVAEPGNLRMLEHKASFMLVRSLLRNKNPNQETCFGQILVEEATEQVLRSWIECNRGAFTLVNLLELEVPEVTAKVKKALEGLNSTLKTKNYEGAKVLLTKLKSS